ncbi:MULTISPECIES: LppU/SCO3897 family protein [unclassified Micromonospora]|uniref:LppU/SCO3897 family protein n=1 Tax=unclassified Micromonospora TaxID=2617518 RepID=UPI003A8369E3
MSSYGPPGYPGPGQPDDPAGQSGYPPPGSAYPPPGSAYPPPGSGAPDPTTPYSSPYQPGGYPPPTSGGGAYPPPPTSGGGGYPPPPGSGGGFPPPPPPGWGPPPGVPGAPPPKKSRTGLIIGLVIGAVVLLLLLCGCGVIGLFALADSGTSTASEELPTVDVSTGTPDDQQGEDSSSLPPPDSGLDLVVVGDCVVNDGSDEDAVLRKVACDPGTFEVLARIPLTTDTERCDDPIFGHPDTDTTYTHDTGEQLLNYVLCMKEL